MAVFLEFWTHVLRHPEHRARFGEAHKRAVEPFQVALERFAAQQGITLAIPADQLATAMFAMENGIGLERLTDPDSADAGPPGPPGGADLRGARPRRGRERSLRWT